MNVNRQISAFAAKVDKKMIKEHVTSDGNHLWHIFTWCNVPCIKGDEARLVFDSLNYAEAYRFTGGYSSKIKNGGSIGKISALDVDNDPAKDIYIVAKDYSWTYVRTHEKGVCGPYLCFNRNTEIASR